MHTPSPYPHISSSIGLDPARSLVANLPRDQALGLRLIALAHAAAAAHMFARVHPTFPDSTPSRLSPSRLRPEDAP